MNRRPKDDAKLIKEIEAQRSIVNFSVSEFTVELLVSKLVAKEIVIPDYQRAFVWQSDVKSRFIESLILNLPVPFLFAADVKGDLEIVDGTQRLRTLDEFLSGGFALSRLELVPGLNTCRFADLPAREQKRLKKRSIRMIELSENADLSVRFELFSRINSGSSKLKDAEFRKGAFPSDFYTMMIELGTTPEFKAVCPISKKSADRGEAAELVLRFFAYGDAYQKFSHGVRIFLNRYLANECSKFDALSKKSASAVLSKRRVQFLRVMSFVGDNFPNGFRRKAGENTTPRVRFEAIAVGSYLALKRRPKLVPTNLNWLSTEKFKKLTRSDGSNSAPRLAARIEYVRDRLLGVK